MRRNTFILALLIIIVLILTGCNSVTKLSQTKVKNIEPNQPSGVINETASTQQTEPITIPIVSNNPIIGTRLISLSAGTSYSLGLTDQGEVLAWGNNTNGELGIGSKVETLKPRKLNIDEQIVQIAAGPNGLVLSKSGALYSWGRNEYGTIGDGTNEERLSPVKVNIPEKIIKIFKGSNIGLALTESGELYTWGWNKQGEVGNSSTENVNTPYKVKLPKKVIDASAFGTHTLVLCEDGSLYAWGSNYFGELGDGKPVANASGQKGELIENNVLNPQRVKIDLKIKAIATGNGASYVLTDDGNVYAWGANDVGQLGVGKEVKYTSTPVKVPIKDKIIFLTSGQFHVDALAENGTLYSWGNNGDFGVIGIGSKEKIIYTPQIVPIREKITFITSGGGHTFVMTIEGKIYGWGVNAFGQLGTGSKEAEQKPVEIKLI